MTREETHELLRTIAGYDGRTVDPSSVLAWHELLADVAYAEARAAVIEHYRESRRRVMPADVRALVRAYRERRIALSPPGAPPVDPDDVPAYREAVAAGVRAVADGMEVPRSISAPTPPTAEFRNRPGREERSVAALSKTCPWCKALPGEHCVQPGSTRRLSRPHPARLDATKENQ